MDSALPEGRGSLNSVVMSDRSTPRAPAIRAASFAFVVAIFLAALGGGPAPRAARAGEEEFTDGQKEVVKPIKTLISAIRYSKDDLAAGFLAAGRMSEIVCADSFAKLTADERREFVDGLAYLLKRLSFPKAREIFEHLDAILYDPPRIEGERAHVKQTVVVFRNYKKDEIILEYAVERIEGKWLVVDVIAEGESTLEGIREDSVVPLLEEGGTALLLKRLREKVAEVKAKEPPPEGDKK